ncbi:hypothetical protein AXF42_Ash019393 [Apostasia shenzhenica]|uniref:Uncharacterized protein n=1 Tax=Apostasia shenzhenica TaxID=1088818 RepID=A0A2I0B4U3_9ASPA|nr:hypothetical protein AXF42_Ash019393 [Apostasia shenzhenica]
MTGVPGVRVPAEIRMNEAWGSGRDQNERRRRVGGERRRSRSGRAGRERRRRRGLEVGVLAVSSISPCFPRNYCQCFRLRDFCFWLNTNCTDFALTTRLLKFRIFHYIWTLTHPLSVFEYEKLEKQLKPDFLEMVPWYSEEPCREGKCPCSFPSNPRDLDPKPPVRLPMVTRPLQIFIRWALRASQCYPVYSKGYGKKKHPSSKTKELITLFSGDPSSTYIADLREDHGLDLHDNLICVSSNVHFLHR